MESKTCTECHTAKPLDEFSIKVAATGRRQAKCKACVRAYGKGHYSRNKDVYLDKAAVHNDAIRARNAAHVQASLLGKRCSCCGSGAELTYYQGVGAKTQPVHMAVSGALSLAKIDAAIARSKVTCEACVHEQLYQGLAPWGAMSQESRDAARALRAAQGPSLLDPGRFKNYRKASAGLGATAQPS